METLERIAIALAITLLVLIMMNKFVYGEVTLCRDSPARGNWIYRIVDGHKCWFEAGGLRRGREKPREELAWPNYSAPEPMEIKTPMRAPWELLERWPKAPEK